MSNCNERLRGERQSGAPKIKEIISENFPNFVKDRNLQTQEAQEKLQTDVSKKFTPRHIIMKLLKTKDKEKTLKQPELNYRGNNNSNNY